MKITMNRESAGNATVRGPPLGRWASATRRGHAFCPQLTIQAWPQTLRADPGPSRVGPFSLLRTRRNLPITIAKRGNKTMKVVKTDENRPMTLREIEICQQFEQSDRSGQALWWPLMAPGNPAPDCLALLEGNGRYALTFLHNQWSARAGEWYHHAEDGAVTPMGDVREDAWEAAMSVKDRLTEDRGCYVIPVMVFTDMTPDPDILEEMRGSRVQLLWGLADLAARLADLPEGDQVQKQLGKRQIAREVEKLSRRPAGPQAAPPLKAAILTVSGGPVTVRDGDDVHIDIHLHCTITLSDDGDDPSLTVRVQ